MMNKTAFVDFFGANKAQYTVEIKLNDFGDNINGAIEVLKTYYETSEWPAREDVIKTKSDLKAWGYDTVARLIDNRVTDTITSFLAQECFRDEHTAKSFMDTALEDAWKMDELHSKKRWVPKANYTDGENTQFVTSTKQFIESSEEKNEITKQYETVIKHFNLYSIQNLEFKATEDAAPAVND